MLFEALIKANYQMEVAAVLVKKSFVCHGTHRGSLGERRGWEVLPDGHLVSSGLASVLEEGICRHSVLRSCFPALGK